MRNGFHSHVCPAHGPYTCPKVTHCQDPQETPCMDCRAQAIADRREWKTSGEYDGDDPKCARWWR